MSKREASQIAAAAGLDVDADAPRAKRRKEASATTATNGASTQEEQAVVIKDEGAGVELAKDDPAAVKERGLRLWQIVKDAVNKESRTLSVDFMRLPSRRQYPDYYVQIKRPIALDDIKTRLDAGEYSSLSDAKEDLETCFKNAKKYNMRESQIWKDAKHLHKLVTKEYAKMAGIEDHGEGGDNAEDGAGGSGDEGEKKKKTPNMTRLLKSRLQKLVEKTDDNGRVIAAEFIDLPNRKQWPIYYKTIKRPICFEMVFKHIKRKEYQTTQDFANDVELIFSNALEFNLEHSPVWEDAVTLRDTFRQLMSDLPPPHSLPQYISDTPKIRLKMPGGANSSAGQPAASSSTNVLRIPASHQTNGAPATAKSPTITPQTPAPLASALSPAAQPAVLTTSTSPVPPPVPTPPQPKSATPAVASGVLQLQPSSSTHSTTYSQHYPNAMYQQPTPTTATPAASASSVPAVQPAAPNSPPAPIATVQSATRHPVQSKHEIKCATLTLEPNGRRLNLDHTEGVRTWAIRLGRDETSVRVSGVSILRLGQEDEESSGDEHEAEEEEEQLEQPEPPKKRGRGRPRKNPLPALDPLKQASPGKAKAKGKASEKSRGPDELELKLNGSVIKDIQKDVWYFALPIGLNTVEVGVRGGIPWKIYMERPF